MKATPKLERDMTVVKWMLGTVITVTLINLGFSVQVLARLPVR